MSKSLETEYKNAVMNDLPDLWGRIEAALPDADKNSEEVVKTETPAPQNEATAVKPVKKKKKIWPWFAAAVPLVAVGLVAVIPIAILALRIGSKSSGGFIALAPTSYDSAANECCEAPMAEFDNAGAAAYEDFTNNGAESIQAYNDAKDIYYDDDANLIADIPKKEADYTEEEEAQITSETKAGGSSETELGMYICDAKIEIMELFEQEECVYNGTIHFLEDTNTIYYGTALDEDCVIEEVLIYGEALEENTEYNASVWADDEGNYQFVVIEE